MARERVLITVKTYPTLSKKYGELVCTAGLREDGTWVRIYPVPFRRLGEEEQYSKYDWIECDLIRSSADVRPESHHPADRNQMVPVGRIGPQDGWRERKRYILQKGQVFTSMEELIAGAKNNARSLATFKPSKILDFSWSVEEEPEWDPQALAQMRMAFDQGDLFEDQDWRETFRVIPKLPYKFSYLFEDETGKKRSLRVLDWEVGALFYNCVKRANGDHEEALIKVKQKYLNEFCRHDVHFFLGTTHSWHFVAPNPWIIIGVAPIPYETQMEFSLF